MKMKIWFFFLLTFILRVDVTQAKEEPKRPWTFLIFLNAHNNLDDFSYKNLNDMEKIGSTEQVNIVVQWASLAGGDTKRFLVKKDNDPDKVTSPIIERMRPVDMGDQQELVRFIKWGAEHYPADHYFVNVWDHGTGWRIKMFGRTTIQDISHDDRSGNYMTTLELAEAIKTASREIGQKIDIYGSDACLMGMVEIAQEMAPAIDYYIGSEELEPGEGWPYDALLERWNFKSVKTAREVSQILVEEYDNYYKKNREAVTLSAFDMSQMESFNTKINAFVEKLIAMPTDQRELAYESARSGVSFYFSDYVDLGSSFSKVHEKFVDKDPELTHLIMDADQTLAQVVVANRVSHHYEGAKGLSMWIPSEAEYDRYREEYQSLKFGSQSGWLKLLETLFK